MVQQNRRTGCLYVVATPIGNLDDITLRAVRVLSNTAVIGCENVVRTRTLLHSLQIEVKDKKFIVLNDAREDHATIKILAMLNAAQDVVIVSDGGTPLISDPGFQLIRAANKEQIPTIPVPGPSAVITIASICPIPLNEYRFCGFLVKKGKRRSTQLMQLKTAEIPTVVFESPHRIVRTLQEMLALDMGTRNVFVGREMTKRFEEYVYTTLQGLYDEFSNRLKVKGEFVLVIDSSINQYS